MYLVYIIIRLLNKIVFSFFFLPVCYILLPFGLVTLTQSKSPTHTLAWLHTASARERQLEREEPSLNSPSKTQKNEEWTQAFSCKRWLKKSTAASSMGEKLRIRKGSLGFVYITVGDLGEKIGNKCFPFYRKEEFSQT